MITSFRSTTLLALLPLALAAEPVTDCPFGARHTAGAVWFAFEAAAHETQRHGGWDFYDGNDKQFWAGSGWRIGEVDHRGKWGLWTPQGNAPHFTTPLAIARRERFVGKIDFASAEPGDESVTLWMNPGREPDPADAIARLASLTISAVDHARPFLAGANYDLTPPRLAPSFAELGAPPSRSDSSEPLATGEAIFRERVHPLLIEKCLACHGDNPAKLKGGLDLRSRGAMLKGGESGEPALVPGHPDQSPLFIAATWQDPDLEMPPKANDRLNSDQIAHLRAWIDAGAPWSSPGDASADQPPTEVTGRWSAPAADGSVQVTTSGGLNPAWTARRYAAADLWAYRPRVAVPPPDNPDHASAHPIDAFIDRQLRAASLAPAPPAEPRTLARRLVYDLTGLPPTAAQLATPPDELIENLLASEHYGERMAQHWLDVTRFADSNGFSRDELRKDAHRYRSYVIASFNEDKPFDRFVKEQIAGDELGLAGQDALSFLWMGPYEFTSMTAAPVARQLWLDDVVNSIGVTFLGQELRCAKCHDHKFDPIPTGDYYALQAVFGATRHHLTAGEFKIRPQRSQSVEILQGGALERPGDPVSPGLLSAIALSNDHPVPAAAKGRRAALAEWIASPQHPLTARVIVNRVWQWHFGRGLVATPNSFGVMGRKPSHPELLDWLAEWFVANDWSIKKLHRLILTSAAYQRSTQHPGLALVRARDPDGALLASFAPRRLTAEEIRDSMLSVSGELDPRVGGPSFRAEINWEVAFQPRLGMGYLIPPWEPEPQRAERNRRSLYAMRIRNLGHPLMEVLNRPGSENSCERRDETTVVTQAFTLFHGEFSHERALALAHRAVQDAPHDPAAQIDRVFELVFARPPSAAERERSRRHVEAMRIHHDNQVPEPESLPSEVTLSSILERSGEPTTQTFPLYKLQHYEQDLKPWDVDAPTRALAELCLVLLNTSEFLYVY